MFLERLAYMLMITLKMLRQRRLGMKPNRDNPLGRILAVYQHNQHVDLETLELRLGEAILKERGRLERFLTSLKVIAVVAPLLGLLGTVTGMIITFQSITLFGTGDPKLMAGGISQALVTTIMGLCVAIPTILFHSLINSRYKELVMILEEQSTGLVAEHAEQLARRGEAPQVGLAG
jgi:biopolymer transport protein ExbB